MIQIYVNEKNLEYDIYALFKAFFPQDEINITVYEDNKESTGIPSFYDVVLSSSKVSCSFSDGDKEILEEEELLSPGKEVKKSAMKRCIYKCIASHTGRSLPWGTLTGIRPAKIPMLMLTEGREDEEIKKYLRYKYLVSEEKIDLSMRIAHREREILKDIDAKEGYSLYIGIPFCPTTCLYCSFTSYPIAKWQDRVDDYLKCVKKELDLVHELYKGRAPDTVYIGGGTPTTLSPDQFKDLIGYLNKLFDLSSLLELTVEAGRPDSITRDKLISLKGLGVSRISINPQTMNDETLKVIGRRHTVDDIRNAFALARECGFDNINTDIILGLPGEGPDQVRHTMDELKKLDPDSITVHSMAIKRAAGMAEYLKEHEELKSINTPDMLKCADEAARSLGMEPYYMYRQKNMTGNFENTGYSKPGCYGIYNILIMEEVQSILAVGAGTVSKRVYEDGLIERCDNVKDVSLYMERLDEMLERKRKLFGSLNT
ncbi:MAG: coproporphyrinogen dehydrogenase HemZ [Lachnospiraceae bacterium]|nr:coproporphyrinogen dehydrogenase HemZ [Lachnospiraceae bacterium]